MHLQRLRDSKQDAAHFPAKELKRLEKLCASACNHPILTCRY